MGEGAEPSSDSRNSRRWGHLLVELPEEPEEVLILSESSGDTYDSLVEDAAAADLVAFGSRWPPAPTSSDSTAGVLEVAFPRPRRVYLLQLHLLERLPPEVRVMFANPEVLKVHFGSDTSVEGKLRRSGFTFADGSVYDLQGVCSVLTGVSPEAPWEQLHSLSLRDAASRILRYEMGGDDSIAATEWDSHELTIQQICYASMEAWVIIRLFKVVYQAQYPQEFFFDDEQSDEGERDGLSASELSGNDADEESSPSATSLRSRRTRPNSYPQKSVTGHQQGSKVLESDTYRYVLLALGLVLFALVAIPTGRLLKLRT